MRNRLVVTAAAALTACCTVAACGSSSSTASPPSKTSGAATAAPAATSGSAPATSGPAPSAPGGAGTGFKGTLTVAYQDFGTSHQLDTQLKKVKTEYEAANPGATVKLLPINADENSYYTKLGLLNRSPSTAPDVLYEDTFLVNSDVASGYLAPLDAYLAKWPDWSQFSTSAQQAGKSLDGKTYGVPIGTDTRGLYYNKQIFAKAGLPTDWKPKTWDDVLTAARTIKAKVPGVIPLNVYSGKGAGEGATMQGFEMLLYGTKNTLFDTSSQKWFTTSQGFKDSLNFVKTVYGGKLGPAVQDALNPNFGQTVGNSLLPKGKLAIDLDGSWLPQNWQGAGAAAPWPQWSTVLGWTAMPTQDGQAPGENSMSGGWLLSVGSHAKDKAAAFDFVSIFANKANSLAYDNSASQIAERADVAADPSYTAGNPSVSYFTNLVKVTHFRPAYTVYPRISDSIQTAMEAVMTGQSSVDSATKAYGQQIAGIAGAGKVQPAP
jgi:multiple sugar transport system substrate-binding protein